MLPVKEYKEKLDLFRKRKREYYKKCAKIGEMDLKNDEEYIRLWDQLAEEYKDVNRQCFNETTLVTKEFFNYFNPILERKLFILLLIPYYNQKLGKDLIFRGIAYQDDCYYYYIEESGEFHFYDIGDDKIESKLEKLIQNTKAYKYVVRYNDGWDDDLHFLASFNTKKEAQDFIAEREAWKQKFKDEFGVSYDSLNGNDFTDAMEL
mgnify:FL=1